MNDAAVTDLRRHGDRLLVVVGASGSGKDSVLRGWLATLPPAARPHLVRRTITRPGDDPHEAHEALPAAAFVEAQARAAFAFAWQAHGLHYGVRWGELAPLERGGWVVMNGSRMALDALRARAPSARVVEIVADPSQRRARLAAREREDAAAAASRLARQAPAVQADLVIANDAELASAVAALDEGWRRMVRAQRTG